MRIHRRLLLFEKDPIASLQKPQLCTPAFCRGLLGACDIISVDDPVRGRHLAEIAEQLAKQLEDRHLLARSYAAHGASLRALGRFPEAEKKYTNGLEFSYSCSCPGQNHRTGDEWCQPDLIRRFAFLRLDQKDYKTAMNFANEALDSYPDKDGKGLALVCRGIVNRRSGQLEDAVLDLSRGIEFLTLGGRWPWLKKLRWMRYSGALQALVVALSHSNDLAAIRRGLDLFPFVRKAWRGLRNLSQARAKLDWAEACLILKAIQLGIDYPNLGNRDDAIEQLYSALDRLSSPVDRAALTADLAAAILPDIIRIRMAFRSLECPSDLQGKRKVILEVTNLSHLIKALENFRESATELGAPPTLFTYERRL